MNLPNWITIGRIMLIPFIVLSLLRYRQTHLDVYRFVALSIFVVTVLSDALDGAIARIRKQKTAVGVLLDPLADKLLLLSSVVLLSLPIQGLHQLPVWVPVTFISRDLILIFGAIVIYIYSNNLKVRPNIWGKITTFLQMSVIIWILLRLPMPYIILVPAGFFTIFSGLIYIYQGSKQLNNFHTK